MNMTVVFTVDVSDGIDPESLSMGLDTDTISIHGDCERIEPIDVIAYKTIASEPEGCECCPDIPVVSWLPAFNARTAL
jgi:hypothetical protein